jgi:transposase, IS30 family
MAASRLLLGAICIGIRSSVQGVNATLAAWERVVSRYLGPRGIPCSVRDSIVRELRGGDPRWKVAMTCGVSINTVHRVAAKAGGVAPRRTGRSARQLSGDDRVEVYLGISTGKSFALIARGLGRPTSTISREVARNGGRARYKPFAAERRAEDQAARPKPTKLGSCPRLASQVTVWLQLRWSPRQISARLAHEFPDDAEMRVSPETIYQTLFVQTRGELRRELTAYLRSRRTARHAHSPVVTGQRRGRLVDMVNISERPAEADDRAVPGHWEGDLIIGKNGKSAVGTLVERSSRFVLLLHLPDGRGAEQVRTAMTAKIATLPAALVRSITWDQGKEQAQHAQFTIDTGIPIYFCDPHHPWQRGTNENTNGLLRDYLPKSTSLSRYTEAELDTIADELNQRPRQTLNWLTPSETFNQFVATTA